ncbi:sensor histidine kinase [Desertibaculum subflavum]|uniref:sensor histidine kinase n=1 Tax=Desertibaculum subflavum TaxID=2268458 RepID=UPI000E6759B6
MTASIPLGDLIGSVASAQAVEAANVFLMRPDRRGIREGVPPALSLGAELLAIAREVAAATRFAGRIDLADARAVPPARPDALPSLTLLVAEAVRNAVRHAHPSGVAGIIRLGCRRVPTGEMVVEIQDDGVGLPEGFDEARHGGGFRLMRAAAARLGAAMTYRSSPLGLRLRFRLPASVLSRPEATAADALLEALPTGIYLTDAAGGITWFNRAAATIWGRRPAPGEKWCGSWKLHDAEGRPLAHADCPMAVALRERRELSGAEATVERPDGSRVPLMVFPTLLRNAAGEVTGAANLMVEIGERKRVEQRQQLLSGELQHRVKNLFAITRAVVAQSLRGAGADIARGTVLGRLQALAANYDRLSASGWSGAALGDVVRDALEAFGDRVAIDGPEVTLNPRAAQSFALAVHELATNAAKHGALSAQGGRVIVTWGIDGEGSALRFRWVEVGGPAVTPPVQKGFGSVMLEQVMAQDFGRAPEIRFAPAGLTYELVAGLDHISPAPA